MKYRIICCGMPRSGLGSLAKLLKINKIKMAEPEVLPYKFDRIKLRRKMKKDFQGDVGHYYLNYIEELVRYHSAKIIVLERDKAKVMKSIKALGYNPYIQKNIPGSEAFPFFAKNLDTAAGFHHYDYCKKIKTMKHRFGGKVLVLPIDSLNEKEGIKKILDFCDIPEKGRKYKKIRINKKFKL